MATLSACARSSRGGAKLDRAYHRILGSKPKPTGGARRAGAKEASVATSAKAMTEARETVVTVRRTLAARREFLFAAWTDPELFIQWFGPKTWTVERCEVDARVGGRWRAWFRRGDGGSLYVGGTYLEVEAPERLVFTWDLRPDGSAPDTLSVVAVTFSQVAGGAEIAITHRKLGTTEAIDMDAGWTNTLDALAAFVATHAFAAGEGERK